MVVGSVANDTCHVLQDNEPLMRALSKLIYVNNPDLVLFVGEALVGNDAVDQLSKFNQVCFSYFGIQTLLILVRSKIYEEICAKNYIEHFYVYLCITETC